MTKCLQPFTRTPSKTVRPFKVGLQFLAFSCLFYTKICADFFFTPAPSNTAAPDLFGNIPTLNKFGFLDEDRFMNPFTKDFLIFSTLHQNAKESPKHVLEIGAGAGHLSLELLKRGARVTVNDMDHRHLDIIQKKIPKPYREKVALKHGRFPEGIDFKPRQFDAVFCRVFQFMSGKDIERGLRKMKSWLKPGGRLYIIGPTIYMDDVQPRAQIKFHKKRLTGDRWPGMHTDPYTVYPRHIAQHMPKTVHLMDLDVMLNAVIRESYQVIRLGYFDSYYIFTGHVTNGRQNYGIIVEKPQEPLFGT